MGIARQFVERIGGKLQNMKAVQSVIPEEEATRSMLSMIPEGETLLLVPKVGRYLYESDIAAVKKNGQIYFSFADIVDVLELSIDYDEVKQTGSGWFLREDWLVDFDLMQKRVTSRGRTYEVSRNDVTIEDGKIYFNEKALGEWLDMQFELNTAEQYVGIKTAYPLPGIARDSRKHRGRGETYANTTRYPRQETEYDMFDINTASVRGQTRYQRSPDSESKFENSGNVAFEGQLLKQDAYGLLTASQHKDITSFTGRLSRYSENSDLLGKLKARSYTIGDTETTDIPLTGGSPQELGFRVSNNLLRSSDFGTTDIDGDALPGWDVELYRNGFLLGNITVDESGRYEFPDVQLFAGDNTFELFFYGPQGEIRSDSFNIPVTEELLATQKGVYDVSVSLADTTLYNKEGSDDQDEGSPHLAARYNTYIGDTLVYGGARLRNIDDKTRLISAAGFTKLWGGTIFDGNFGMDDQLNKAIELTARKNIDEWRVAVAGALQDSSYATGSEDSPGNARVSANVIKTFQPFAGVIPTFSLNAQHSKITDGPTSDTVNAGLSVQARGISVSDSVSYESTTGGGSPDKERIDNSISARGRWGKLGVRGGVAHNIKPDSGIRRYFADVDYRFNNKLSADLSLEHEPLENLTTGRLDVNYLHDKFQITPFVEADTDKNLFAGMSVNFDMIKKPYQAMPEITSRRMIGSGYASSFVYFDKNGNMIFDNDDEPLPGVIVESLNVYRREATDNEGYSLITNLPPTRATDIQIDNSTLPDPFMISAVEGISVMPPAGETVELEFPVHMAGEVDGNVTIRDEYGAQFYATRGEVQLFPLDSGNLTMSARIASDGYFLLSHVPPGRYLMMLANESAKRLKAGMEMPQIVTIDYSGTTLYGQKLEMMKGIKNVPVTLREVQSGIRPGAMVYVMKVREGSNDGLLNMLRKFAVMKSSGGLLADLEKMETTGETEPHVQYYRFADNDMQRTYERCRAMLTEGISCEMTIFVRSKDSAGFKTAMK